jgi:membrane protein YdbS with pleckstrin-like domain
MPRLVISFLLDISLVIALGLGLSLVHFSAYIPYLVLIGLVLLVIFGLITSAMAYIEFTNLKYLIEEHALFLKEGVFEVDTETIPFQKIRNAAFYQTFLQRLYKVGDLVIDQDPETYTWSGIDTDTARIIMDAVSDKSNIQPISFQPDRPS